MSQEILKYFVLKRQPEHFTLLSKLETVEFYCCPVKNVCTWRNSKTKCAECISTQTAPSVLLVSIANFTVSASADMFHWKKVNYTGNQSNSTVSSLERTAFC